MSSHPVAEIIETHGCSISLRRFEGPEARELFLHCQPSAESADAAHQAEAIYRAILGVFQAYGASFGSVVSEMVFLRNLRANIASFREGRLRVLTAFEETFHRPATLEIEQHPLHERACLEVLMQAVVPNEQSRFDLIETKPACGCAECARAHGLRLHLHEEARFHASGLCGHGEDVYEQTHNMFELAEQLLLKAGMEFRNVVRTWIHLRDIDRDYTDLNRARREFFEARGIDPVPASTGIAGGPVAEMHDLCLSVYAVKAGRPPERTVMMSPTLNEAAQYGADFVRGMRMVETNKVALHISGTASIDEDGNTAHPNDFEAQAERMLVNIAALLEGQGASFGDVVSAITYLKHPADAGRLREALKQAGFDGFPNALVAADLPARPTVRNGSAGCRAGREGSSLPISHSPCLK